MEYPVIRAKDRALVGTGIARKVRELGFVPAVVYGGTAAGRNIVVDPKVVGALLRSEGGRNKIAKLSIEGENPEQCLVVVREFQLETLKRTILHCDFMRVEEETPIVVKVPVKVVGKSEAEKLGAVVKVTMRYVTMKCPAAKIPEALIVNADVLNMGDTLKISQLPLPEGAKPVFIRDNKVVIVSMPKADKEEAAAAPAEGAEVAAAEGAAAPAAAAAPEHKGADHK